VIENNNYKLQIPIQIRFIDIDRLDHVNNACYLSFFELGRVHYFNQVLNKMIDWSTQGFILARTEIDHIQPIFLYDEVYCYTRVIKLGNKSLTFENLIVKKEKDIIVDCAKGIGVLVAMDYIKRQSIEIPEVWRKAIVKFEGQSFI
jgi:acyl-CoA thioester hydrolase